MPTIQQMIAERFLQKLADSGALDEDKLGQLRALLADSNKKPKADDFVKIFSTPAGGDIK
jgi:hypothetical protein